MNITAKIEYEINKLQEGTTFKYQQLGIDRGKYNAAAKAIERFIKKGVIKRLTTGVFYKPKQSVFGELRPREEELLKPYLFQGKKRIAYITGGSLYNRMGLTTQVPQAIKVASKAKRVTTKIGKIQVKPVKSYVDVNNENYYLLEILDALKDFKTIPDLDRKSAIILLKNEVSKLTDNDRSKTVQYALQYPPRVQALLGAILEFSGERNSAEILKNSLNPLTSYKLGIKEVILPTAPNWNIY
ncbi:DUF6088 family protein [Pontibacter mangrovi]|uniref:AbiEi antitoxin C-terminal domain-containing protein n=1 Tax=Pontibacter mangrovi TaxID=2589816 RepID=A0A501VYZ2_9BACT|nr:DUF6088 family protein [Pontibacter mangrovi]TPE41064.1 hypothetical protein FJM65_19680 [Pontibacter mangrovi]